jgi:predicted RNA-binding protein with PUA-like domain
MRWLFKEEPTHYAYDALARDKTTRWSGVKNPLAQQHLKAVRRGDPIFYYHTGKQKAVVGVARAVTDAYPDPGDRTGKRSAVDVAAVRPLARPVTLAEIRKTRSLADLPLVRISRLSVMPVSGAQWEAIVRLSERPPGAAHR